MTRLLVATTNAGKLAEIRRILAGTPVELVSLDSVPRLEEPQETERTFAGNARRKALYYARATGLPTVAEDAGLEIDALDGAPGVRSARFNGETYPEKFREIYSMLDARGVADSTARFVCALALAVGDEIVFEARGTVEGRITREPRGSAGFGYDPIFFFPPFGRTLAEVTSAEKASVSHRGKAFRALRAFIEEDVGRLSRKPDPTPSPRPSLPPGRG